MYKSLHQIIRFTSFCFTKKNVTKFCSCQLTSFPKPSATNSFPDLSLTVIAQSCLRAAFWLLQPPDVTKESPYMSGWPHLQIHAQTPALCQVQEMQNKAAGGQQASPER